MDCTCDAQFSQGLTYLVDVERRTGNGEFSEHELPEMMDKMTRRAGMLRTIKAFKNVRRRTRKCMKC